MESEKENGSSGKNLGDNILSFLLKQCRSFFFKGDSCCFDSLIKIAKENPELSKFLSNSSGFISKELNGSSESKKRIIGILSEAAKYNNTIVEYGKKCRDDECKLKISTKAAEINSDICSAITEVETENTEFWKTVRFGFGCAAAVILLPMAIDKFMNSKNKECTDEADTVSVNED